MLSVVTMRLVLWPNILFTAFSGYTSSTLTTFAVCSSRTVKAWSFHAYDTVYYAILYLINKHSGQKNDL